MEKLVDRIAARTLDPTPRRATFSATGLKRPGPRCIAGRRSGCLPGVLPRWAGPGGRVAGRCSIPARARAVRRDRSFVARVAAGNIAGFLDCEIPRETWAWPSSHHAAGRRYPRSARAAAAAPRAPHRRRAPPGAEELAWRSFIHRAPHGVLVDLKRRQQTAEGERPGDPAGLHRARDGFRRLLLP